MIALVVVCLIVLIALVVYLLFFFIKKDNKSVQEIAPSKEVLAKTFHFESDKKQELTNAILTINSCEFVFSYEPKHQKEIHSIMLFIKDSFTLFRSSKYKDVMESRINEINDKLRRLLQISSMDKTQLSSIIDTIKQGKQNRGEDEIL